MSKTVKHIYLYSPYWSSLGGGEKYLLLLAITLSRIADTSITLLATEQIEKRSLEGFFGLDLSDVRLQIIAKNFNVISSGTKNADMAICLSNFRKVKTSARLSIQLLQIPYGKITRPSVIGKTFRGQVKEAAKDIYRLQLHSYAQRKADLVVTNSQFVHDTLLRNFGISSSILHPPIDDFYRDGFPKRNVILSVGRFFAGLYNEKRYDILTQAFRELYNGGLTSWEYHVVGSYREDAASEKMLKELERANQRYPVFFHVNESLETLQRLYNEATIFWHAAGYEVDEELHPENVEHFGMTTVEAMSAGCIPVVIKKGGQKEILLDGVNGFSWSTIGELITRSVEIARGRVPLAEIRQNARKRAEDFSVNRFRRRVVEIFSPFLS